MTTQDTPVDARLVVLALQQQVAEQALRIALLEARLATVGTTHPAADQEAPAPCP